MSVFLSVFLSLITLSAFGAFEEQSRFVGPVDLKVWSHLQASWNVEEQKTPYGFTLVRSADGHKGRITLTLHNDKSSDVEGTLQCTAFASDGEWSINERTGNKRTAAGSTNNKGETLLIWDDADDCVDVNKRHVTKKLDVLVTNKSKAVFEYSFVPMYVRGKTQAYWNNPVPGINAHDGKGEIHVSTLITDENQKEKWNGTLVRPIIAFSDRNTLSEGAVIGLHRHQENQEIYLIESGEAEMVMGLAPRAGANYRVKRVHFENGEIREGDEFVAKGGWKETRVLKAGEASIIVPNKDPNTVFFHGLQAKTKLVFWTMGSRN